MSELDSIICKHVLKNAFDYGKASPGSVVGKVIAEFPDCKSDMKETMKRITNEITRVSKLSKENIEREMAGFTYAERKEEKKALTLPNGIEGKVVTRFPPEPSGYPHIGHAKAGWLDYECARTYGGKMILRFDDTNPEKESYQFVEAIKAGLEWLGVKWDGNESFTSDNIQSVYESVRTLINAGKAYVCTCSQEVISKGRTESKPCPCRTMNAESNMGRWERMVQGDFDEGQAVLRYLGDLSADNTVMRDPTLARIIETKHYRQLEKYRVWPSYDLAVCVMDHLEGVTHSMRSKEYELRDELSLAIYKALGWDAPQLVGFSRLSIKNAPISKRLLLPLVNEKKVMGWDDPRLPTLAGLKRRGIMPEAIKTFVLSFGLSKVESEPDLEALLAENRKILDPQSPHFFFVPDPVKISVEGLKEGEIELRLHPKKEMGSRKVKITKDIYIPRSDTNGIKQGDIFRLKDLSNVKVESKKKDLHGHLSEDGIVDKKLQWVGSDNIACEVLVPKDLLGQDGQFNPGSLEIITGYCELSCTNLEIGTIVQFERFGFCRLDRKEASKLVFIFSC